MEKFDISTLPEVPALSAIDAIRSFQPARLELNINGNLTNTSDTRLFFTVVTYRGSAAGWDDFAIRCGGSFRTAYHAARLTQIGHICYRLTRLMVLHDGARVAQTAVAIGLRSRHFIEGIQILPDAASQWKPIMQAVLHFLGAGHYHYGSKWSLEPARDRELLAIEHTHINASRTTDVFAIDFMRWVTWEDYLRAVSTNAKRNFKKATRLQPDIRLRERTGLGCLRHIGHHLRLRHRLYSRKLMHPRLLKFAIRFAIRNVVLRSRIFTVVACAAGDVIAAFSGIRFGRNTYYMESAASEKNNGVSWFLLLQLIQQAHQRAPTGYFVTGYHRSGAERSLGLEQFRAQCCAVAHETSEMIFTYTPTPRGLENPVAQSGLPPAMRCTSAAARKISLPSERSFSSQDMT